MATRRDGSKTGNFRQIRVAGLVALAGILHSSVSLGRADPTKAGMATRPEPKPEDERSLGVGVVMDSRLTGLSTLELGMRNALRADARAYVQFKRRRSSRVVRQGWQQRCLAGEVNPLFCRSRDWEEPSVSGGSRRKGPVRTSGQETAQVLEAMVRGDVAPFGELTDSAIARGFGKVGARQDFAVLEKAVLSGKACELGRLSILMAQKLEDFLPDPAALESAVALYSRTGSCEDESEWSERGRYRAALLLISAGKWAQASPLLDRLAQNRRSDYYSRALYWRARAEKARGNHLGYAQLSSRLTKEFPIHYHSLLLAQRVFFNSAHNLSLPEPEIHLESAKVGREWNDRARAVEALQEAGAPEMNRELFGELEEMMEKVEPEARLYLAILQQRNGNAIGTFRVLSSLFRESPAMLSRQTLAIFFPFTKPIEQALRIAQGGGLDPYLIAALIRQESGFVTHARSPAGALGLMQLMPATARSMERVNKRELLDGRTNVRLGVKFFRRLLTRFDGKVDHALAAYNAGPLRVDEWQRRYPVSDPVLFVDLIPFKETREYVSLISRNYYWYLQIYARHLFDERLDEKTSTKSSERARELASAEDLPVRTGNKSPLEFSIFHSH